MSSSVVVDTSFLISLFDRKRPHHEAAKSYYKHYLEQGTPLFLPTVVVAEFAQKQPITDIPLRNFRVLPFTLLDAVRCADLNWSHYRKAVGTGQRDAVKDDFKILAQAEEQSARFLLTEDDETMATYCSSLQADAKIHVRLLQLKDGFDLATLNEDNQRDLPLSP